MRIGFDLLVVSVRRRVLVYDDDGENSHWKTRLAQRNILAQHGSQLGHLWLVCLYDICFFTARRYAMLTLCPSIRSSITNRYYIETTERLNESSWFWHRSFLRPIILCVIRKFGYLRDYWYFLLELCSKLLENFATGSRSCCQKTRRRSSLLTTHATVDASWPHAHGSLHVGRL